MIVSFIIAISISIQIYHIFIYIFNIQIIIQVVNNNYLFYKRLFIGTAAVSQILDPGLLIIQAVFIFLWSIILVIHLQSFNNLRKIYHRTPVQHYRYRVSQVGTLQALSEILYWSIHQSKYC